MSKCLQCKYPMVKNVHNVISPLFVSFCAILYSLAMFSLFLHWNPSPNPETFCNLHYLAHSGLLIFADFADFGRAFCTAILEWVILEDMSGHCLHANSQFELFADFWHFHDNNFYAKTQENSFCTI